MSGTPSFCSRAKYAAFCQAAFGMFIHHVPRTSRSPQVDELRSEFLGAYAEVFGQVPQDWYGVKRADRAVMGDEPSGCGTEDCTDG